LRAPVTGRPFNFLLPLPSLRSIAAKSSPAVKGKGVAHSAIPVRVAGENDDLELTGKGTEDIQDALLAHGVRVHQNVIEDEDLRLVGREFLSHGNPQALQQLFFGTLREVFERVNFLPRPADPGNLKMFVQEHLSSGVASQFGKGNGESLFERRQHGLGRGLLAMLDQVVGDAGTPTLSSGRVPAQNRLRLLFFQLSLPGVKAQTAQRFERSLGLVTLGPTGL